MRWSSCLHPQVWFARCLDDVVNIAEHGVGNQGRQQSRTQQTTSLQCFGSPKSRLNNTEALQAASRSLVTAITNRKLESFWTRGHSHFDSPLFSLDVITCIMCANRIPRPRERRPNEARRHKNTDFRNLTEQFSLSESENHGMPFVFTSQVPYESRKPQDGRQNDSQQLASCREEMASCKATPGDA